MSQDLQTKTKKKDSLNKAILLLLSDQGSNLDQENQNLSCYRYTIGQDVIFRAAKLGKKIILKKIFPKNLNLRYKLSFVEVQ